MDLFILITIIITATILGFIVALPLISLLERYGIARDLEVDFSAVIDRRQNKQGTLVMGGLLIVIVVLLLNLAFNFTGSTKVPILVFAISAALGGLDDLLNIYGQKRKVKPLHRIAKLIRVHAKPSQRLKYLLTFPWHAYKNFFFMLGSNPGKGIQAHEKILINSIAGLAVYWWLAFHSGWLNPSVLYFPFELRIDIGILLLPFVVLTVLVMTNAVNIADGMDGLAAGMLVPSFLAFMVIAIMSGNASIAILCGTVIGSLLSYLYFNVPPARIQMGDVGSLALGTLLAVIALEMRVPFLLLIICFPFIAEFLSSLVQGIWRRIFGQRLLLMAPLHHHFEMLGWKEEKVVMRFWLLSIFCAFLGVWVFLLF